MMLTLGLFVFQLQTLPYQNMQRNVDYRWPSNSRVGQRPALQFLGIEEEKITLSGELLPEITGGKLSLLMLETMADQGHAWPLIEGSGTIYGVFVVNSISQKKTDFSPDGSARRIEFTVTLTRVDSSLSATLGAIVEQVAKRNNLTPILAGGFAGIKIPHIDQTQETDATFITRLAERNGAIAAVKAGWLLFIRAGTGKRASGKSIPQQIIERSDGDQHSFSLADRGAYTGVTASWLHTKEPKPKKVMVKRTQKILLHQGPQEAHPKAKKPTKTPEAHKGEYMVGTDENVLSLTTLYATKEQAMHDAQAKWDSLQRGVAGFSITLAMGRADLFPETPVQVSGFKQVIDEQMWTISKVTHALSNNGYITTLELEVRLSDVEYEGSEWHRKKPVKDIIMMHCPICRHAAQAVT